MLTDPFFTAGWLAFAPCEYSRGLLNLSSPLVFLCRFAPYNAWLSSALQALLSPLLMIHWDAHVP